jgi:ABC-type oligopeptide transport system ATPase subunit
MTLREEKVEDIKWEGVKEKGKDKIITVDNLKTYYPIFGGLFKRRVGDVKAVDGVTFKLYKNETLGLVGESGCGKTTIGNTILNLVPNTDGEIYYANRRIDPLRFQDISEQLAQRFRNFYISIIPIIREKLYDKLENMASRLPKYLRKIYSRIKKKAISINQDFLIDKFLRKKVQMVFQDPDASLNPRWKVVNIIGEPLRILEGINKVNFVEGF